MSKQRIRRRTFRAAGLFGMIISASIILSGLAAAVGADEGVNVSCYLGNVYIGNTVVYDVRTAANACNDLYRDCRDECSGCFHDFDYVEDVCVGPNNTMYLR